MVLNAANLKRLPAVQLPRQHLLVAPRPQHLAVVAKEFLAEAYLEVVVGCLEETAAVAVDAAAVVAYLAVAVGCLEETAVVDAAAVVGAAVVAYLAVAVLDSEPLELALQKPSATTKSFLSGPSGFIAVDVCGSFEESQL